MYRILLSVIVLLMMSTAVQAQEVVFRSGPQQAVLLELFTSQGCSSCPPAEAYLNSFKSNRELWQTYFPVAFHVDYWDYIGWKDRFAHPRHTRHQEAYARSNAQRTIYTPGFYLNGRPWRRGFFSSVPDTPGGKTGVLELRYDDRLLTAEYRPPIEAEQELTLHTVLLGMDLQTDIRAGENAGRHSEHEFVVLRYIQTENTSTTWRVSLPTDHDNGKARALVAWVSGQTDPTPLQVAGGYLR